MSKKTLVLFSLFLIPYSLFVLPIPAYAACTSGSVDCPAAFSDLTTVFSSIVGLALAGVGIAVLVMFIIGGYQYLMAGSDKDAATKARNTLTYAIIGFILAVSAWIILSLLGSFLGVDFSNFTLNF